MSRYTLTEKRALNRYRKAILSVGYELDQVNSSVSSMDSWLNNHAYMQELLQQYEVTDRSNLAARMEWLITTGYRQECNQMMQQLLGLSDSQRESYIQGIPSLNPSRAKLEIANLYCGRLPIKDALLAYDCTTMLLLCEAGIRLEWVKKSSRWSCTQGAVKLIHQTYSGWSEYIAGYAAGRQYAAGDKQADYIAGRLHYWTQLLTTSTSPMYQLQV